MEQTFEQLVREFKALVAFQQSGKGETVSPTEKQEIRKQIGKLVDAIATMVVGIPCAGMKRLTAAETVVLMSSVRQDVFDRLDAEGIKYGQYANDGAVAVRLTDKDTGICIYRNVTDAFDSSEIYTLMNNTPMERALVH
jgi:hypothetical protein